MGHCHALCFPPFPVADAAAASNWSCSFYACVTLLAAATAPWAAWCLSPAPACRHLRHSRPSSHWQGAITGRRGPRARAPLHPSHIPFAGAPRLAIEGVGPPSAAHYFSRCHAEPCILLGFLNSTNSTKWRCAVRCAQQPSWCGCARSTMRWLWRHCTVMPATVSVAWQV